MHTEDFMEKKEFQKIHGSFQERKGSGYGIELDVQLTKDGVMVVHHDYDLKRTCGVNKKITDLTYRELCRYRLMGTRERIPRFVEVLREVDGKVPLLVELKMETCNRKLCKKSCKSFRSNIKDYIVWNVFIRMLCIGLRKTVQK